MDEVTQLDLLIEAVNAGGDLIGIEASHALDPQPHVWAVQAYGQRNTLGSLDAALALHEALLPGWRCAELGQAPDGLWVCRLSGQGPSDGRAGDSFVSGARAWLIAILHAYRDTKGGDA